MKLANKTKIALDESRTLMLGAQILLGFQLQAPFQNAFGALPGEQKRIAAAILLLMVVVVGLIIAPSARHRIVEKGEATEGINHFITEIAKVTLPLFAVALGLDLHVAIARILGETAGMVTALVAIVTAVLLWGLPYSLRRQSKEVLMQEDSPTPTEKKIEYVLTESRVVLPGAQAILGFQLAIVLTQGFGEMPFRDQIVHAIALAEIAMATILLIAPASIHRLVYEGKEVPEFHKVASTILLAATVFLALGLSTDIFVVLRKISDSDAVSLFSAIASACVLFGLWHVWPWFARQSAS